MTTRIGISNGFGQGAAHESGQHGFVTANVLQRDDWRRAAARESELRRALRTAGAEAPARVAPLRASRVSVAIGGALVRLGTRLQGETRTTATAAAR